MNFAQQVWSLVVLVLVLYCFDRAGSFLGAVSLESLAGRLERDFGVTTAEHLATASEEKVQRVDALEAALEEASGSAAATVDKGRRQRKHPGLLLSDTGGGSTLTSQSSSWRASQIAEALILDSDEHYGVALETPEWEEEHSVEPRKKGTEQSRREEKTKLACGRRGPLALVVTPPLGLEALGTQRTRGGALRAPGVGALIMKEVDDSRRSRLLNMATPSTVPQGKARGKGGAAYGKQGQSAHSASRDFRDHGTGRNGGKSEQQENAVAANGTAAFKSKVVAVAEHRAFADLEYNTDMQSVNIREPWRESTAFSRRARPPLFVAQTGADMAYGARRLEMAPARTT